jgi:electron transport complex protein RnfG
MKSLMKFTITLGVLGVIVGLLLITVYRITLPVINSQDLKALNEGLASVFPGNNTFEKLNKTLKSPDQTITIGDSYEVKNSGNIIGLVVTVSSPGSQAPIKMLVGVKKDGNISGVKILSMSETPGLGANADNPTYFVNKDKKLTFLGQFTGKNVEKDAFVPKQDIVALTGATITSNAVSKGVKIAGEVGYNYLKGVVP